MHTSTFSQSRIAAKKKWSQGGGGLGRYCPGPLAHPPTTSIPHARPGMGYICDMGVLLAGTTARAKALTQIVLNSSSLYTLFYSVIYNSVHSVYRCLCSSRNRLGFYADIQKYFWDSVRALQ